MTSLFDPIAFGAIAAPNRIMMAPLTRGRATRSHVPTPYALLVGACLEFVPRWRYCV
jgi:2,4-dienoyl-CoA reductase-like NADH-dependent reductase (Old Yellow Enzyme family)